MALTPEQSQNYLDRNPDLKTFLATEAGQAQASRYGGEAGFAEAHLAHARATGENRDFRIDTPVPEAEKFATQEQVQNLQTAVENIDVNPVVQGGGATYYSTVAGPEVDYSRIQGFIGVPELRDEQGNITQEATGIYAQQPQIPTGLMAAQEATQQAIGQAAVDPDTGEAVQPATLFEGQATLGAGQAQLGQQLGAGQAGLMAGQQALGEGQSTIGQAIGVPDDKQPQTLFGGQMALGQGQQGIQTGVTGLGKDLGTLTGDLSAFEKASRAYQTRAEGQRAQGREIGMTTRDELEDQLRTVGQQTNRIAEQQAQQRQLGMMGPPPQTQQPPVMPQAQQATQAAQIAGQNLRSFAPQGGGMMGPTGPVAVDPRDQIGFGPTRSPV
tara:strand:+ start:84 stop:1235 length:1152 start_codon:yes stop_codon:yes gene_type:complete